MPIDPGAKQDVGAWMAFTQPADIPDWISQAYLDSYQRRGEEDSQASQRAAEAAASVVTPAMLSAHYRLGQHRPMGESRVAVYPADDRSGSGRRCKWSPSTAAC